MVRRSTAIAAAVLAVALIAMACATSSSASGPGSQTLTDTAGRKVKVPAPSAIRRVATVGYSTTLDSFIYVVGAQNLLVNGIPPADSATFLLPYQVLAPRLLHLPNVESTIDGALDPEELLALKPNVVLTSDAATAQQVQSLGIPALVVFDLGSGSAIERDVSLVGKLLGRQTQAAAYTGYFQGVINQAKQGVASIPAATRPSALYADFGPLTQPTTVEGWEFGVLGVRNVVPGVVPDHFPFTDEQVYVWNPDYIVCQQPADLPQFTKSPAFATLGAVKDGHVEVIPSGFNIWGDNTVEIPLGILWTAKYLFPSQFANVDLAQQTTSFYSRFFHVTLRSAQVTTLLNAGGLAPA
jgi:iron complex transport system substrate-binding protein